MYMGDKARANCVNGLVLERPDTLSVLDKLYRELWEKKRGGKFTCAKKRDGVLESYLLEKAQGFHYFCVDEEAGEATLTDGISIKPELAKLLGGKTKSRNFGELKRIFATTGGRRFATEITQNAKIVVAGSTQKNLPTLLNIERSIYSERERLKKIEIEIDGGGSGTSFDGDLKMKTIGMSGKGGEFIIYDDTNDIWIPIGKLDDIILTEILHGGDKSLMEVWKKCVNKLNRLAGYLADEGTLTWDTFTTAVEEFLMVYGQGGLGLLHIK